MSTDDKGLYKREIPRKKRPQKQETRRPAFRAMTIHGRRPQRIDEVEIFSY